MNEDLQQSALILIKMNEKYFEFCLSKHLWKIP